jgi:hypothetical protein
MAKEAFCHKVEEIVSRNPRRAYDKAGREIAPATMANIREQGINTLWATCQRIGCGHEAKIGVHAPTRSRRPSRVLLPTRWNRPAQGIATATTTAGQLQGPGAPSVSPTSVSAPKAICRAGAGFPNAAGARAGLWGPGPGNQPRGVPAADRKLAVQALVCELKRKVGSRNREVSEPMRSLGVPG